jgi:hypothetical protein
MPRLRRGADVNRRVACGWLLRMAVATVAGARSGGHAGAAEPTLSRAEWAAIRKVISQQLAALRAGAAQRAFGFASPGIQAQFGDAENFLTMVRTAYAPLLDARYTEFLEGAAIDGAIVQPLRLIARDNTVLVALYTMERLKGAWRINGCQLARSTVRAAQRSELR